MRKGLIMLAAAATLGSVGFSSAASAADWHHRGHDRWEHRDRGRHHGWRNHDRDDWRWRRWHHRRHHHRWYRNGYYNNYYNGYYGSGYGW